MRFTQLAIVIAMFYTSRHVSSLHTDQAIINLHQHHQYARIQTVYLQPALGIPGISHFSSRQIVIAAPRKLTGALMFYTIVATSWFVSQSWYLESKLANSLKFIVFKSEEPDFKWFPRLLQFIRLQKFVHLICIIWPPTFIASLFSPPIFSVSYLIQSVSGLCRSSTTRVSAYQLRWGNCGGLWTVMTRAMTRSRFGLSDLSELVVVRNG